MRTVLNSPVDPLVGRLLDGRYEVTGRLAQGGMAVVYAAFDTRLDRPVAVKVMHPAFAADEDFVARFRREAKAAARLTGPHVVAVTDQGRDGDVIFLVMELIEGRTLREVLREQGPLPAAEALAVLVPVLEALAGAHRAGLVHRDVKPENVLVGDDGTVKVADFGLARAVDASPLTATAGLLLGTVAYLAPEQVSRGVADARADVYASGVMLFELLTGRPPFEGGSALQVAYLHLNENVPPPSQLQPTVPPAVDRLVLAATAREPADRPRDATALLLRTRAVLERLASPLAPGLERHDTAPLPLDLAEASALELARRGRPASSGLGEALTHDGEPAPPQLEPEPSDVPPASSARPVDLPTEALPGAKPDRRRRRLLRPGRIVAVVVILLTIAAAMIGWRLAGRTVVVPAVVGQSPAAATAALKAAHLSPQISRELVYSETVPKGNVGTASPAPGHHTSRGGTVVLKLSLGPERYTVPTLARLSLADAVNALRVAHLQPGAQTNAYHDTVRAGAVISTTPAAGVLAKPDTPVALVVSRGPAPVTPPSLAGLTPDAAQLALTKLGLKVTRTDEFSETAPIGQIIGITPSTGLHRMQSVSLRVSKGPRLVQIPPNIENLSPGYAKQLLTSLGVNVVIRSFPGLDSSILTVRPGPGSQVRLGSQVTMYLY